MQRATLRRHYCTLDFHGIQECEESRFISSQKRIKPFEMSLLSVTLFAASPSDPIPWDPFIASKLIPSPSSSVSSRASPRPRPGQHLSCLSEKKSCAVKSFDCFFQLPSLFCLLSGSCCSRFILHFILHFIEKNRYRPCLTHQSKKSF